MKQSNDVNDVVVDDVVVDDVDVVVDVVFFAVYGFERVFIEHTSTICSHQFCCFHVLTCMYVCMYITVWCVLQAHRLVMELLHRQLSGSLAKSIGVDISQLQLGDAFALNMQVKIYMFIYICLLKEIFIHSHSPGYH